MAEGLTDIKVKMAQRLLVFLVSSLLIRYLFLIKLKN